MKRCWSILFTSAIYISHGSELPKSAAQGRTDEGLVLIYEHSTPNAHYEYFEQVHLGKPLWQKGCIVWYSNKGTTHRLDFCAKEFKIAASPTNDFDYWYPFEGMYYPVTIRCRSPNGSDGVQEFCYENKVLDTYCNLRNQDQKHRIWVHAFLPNPIHATSLVYGRDVSDNFDANSMILENQLHRTYIDLDTLIGEKGISLARVIFQNVSAPNIEEKIDFSKSLFGRDEVAFESWHVLYHLNRFAMYLHTSGYDHLIAPVQIDPHALNGVDKSVFNSLRSPPSIEFGIGGVDDAEDAQVIVHEYMHALAYQASPFSYTDKYQKAVEEGISDFFALYYSYLVSGQLRPEIYTWDGHNEFWEGLKATSVFEETIHVTTEYYDERSQWLSVFYSLAQRTGFDVCASLLLEFLHQNHPFTSNSELAIQLLQLSNDLYGKETKNELAIILEHLKIIEPEDLAVEGIRKIYVQGNVLRIRLKEEQSISSYRIQLYHLSGKLLEEIVQFQPEIQIDFKECQSGMYPLRVEINQSLAVRSKELFLLVVKLDVN